MKTRFAYFILSVIAALVISSCDKTEIRRSSLEDANLIIRLNTDSVIETKTPGTPGTPGSDSYSSSVEKKISDVRVFLVQADEDGTPVEGGKVSELTEFETTDNKTTITGKVFGLESNYQLLYVLANCPDAIKTSISTTDYESFIGSFTKLTDAQQAQLWTADHFFMVNGVDSNVSDTSSGKICYNGGVLVNFTGSSVSATVNLEHVAAKIIAGQTEFMDFAAYHTKVYGPTDDQGYVISSAKIVGWTLLNTVRSFNLIQKFDSNKNEVTPSSSLDYPVWKLGDTSCDGYTNYDPSAFMASDFVWKAPGDSTYCLENNSPIYPKNYIKKSGATPAPAVSDTKMKGRVTAIIFRAQILLADGFDSGIDAPEGIDEDEETGEWTKGTYNMDIAKTVYKYKNKYYASLGRLCSDNSSLGTYTDITADDPDIFADLRSKGVQVYEQGYMYYTYWIADTDTTGANHINAIAPYYCVERNKLYRINVRYVGSFGDDRPCDCLNYDPEDPVDMAIPRINVSIQVSGWYENDPVSYDIQ